GNDDGLMSAELRRNVMPLMMPVNFFRRRHLVGAAVLVLIAVLGLGLVRALVLLVDDAVLVVIGIGAAVLVLELVLVLGLVGALVLAIDDPVAVPVLVRAAVVLLRAGFGRALVLVVRDAVVVAVLDQDGRRRRGRFVAAEREAEAEHELTVGGEPLRLLVG